MANPILGRHGSRNGVKAILTGSIAPLGKAYVVSLDAQNTASGDDVYLSWLSSGVSLPARVVATSFPSATQQSTRLLIDRLVVRFYLRQIK
jgi:hypothetical protein